MGLKAMIASGFDLPSMSRLIAEHACIEALSSLEELNDCRD